MKDLQCIDIRHTSLAVIEEQEEPKHREEKAWSWLGASVALNVVLAALVYILQAGQI